MNDQDVIDNNKINEKTREYLFARDKILSKTSDNMTEAEARTHERPLWTEKTYELEKQEAADEK
jgi:hypothetical protein